MKKLFKEFYKKIISELKLDNSVVSMRRRQIERRGEKAETKGEQKLRVATKVKEHNAKVKAIELLVEKSGVTCQEYQKLGFKFNGVLEIDRIKESSIPTSDSVVKGPALIKKITTDLCTCEVYIPIHNLDLMPSTIEEVQEYVYQTIAKKSAEKADKRRILEDQRLFVKELLRLGGKPLIQLIRSQVKPQSRRSR